MITPKEAIALITAQSQFGGHSDASLNRGLIQFASKHQARFLASLTKQCGCPENRRYWLVGQFVEREITSTKDISIAQMGALLGWILHGSDGQGQVGRDENYRPCEEAVKVISLMLTHESKEERNEDDI